MLALMRDPQVPIDARLDTSHGEAFARHAAEIAFASDGAVKHGVADDNRFFRHYAGIHRRPDNDAPAGKALADIVVGGREAPPCFMIRGNLESHS